MTLTRGQRLGLIVGCLWTVSVLAAYGLGRSSRPPAGSLGAPTGGDRGEPVEERGASLRSIEARTAADRTQAKAAPLANGTRTQSDLSRTPLDMARGTFTGALARDAQEAEFEVFETGLKQSEPEAEAFIDCTDDPCLLCIILPDSSAVTFWEAIGPWREQLEPDGWLNATSQAFQDPTDRATPKTIGCAWAMPDAVLQQPHLSDALLPALSARLRDYRGVGWRL